MLVNVNEFCQRQKFLHYDILSLGTVQDLYKWIPGQTSAWEMEGLKEKLEQAGKDAWIGKKKLLVGEAAPLSFCCQQSYPK